MSNILTIKKVAALPGSYTPSTMYLVSTADADRFDMYVSSADGSTIKHLITKSEIQTLINTAMSTFSNITVVADIAARNALAPTAVAQAFVLNATADSSVTSGAATYIYNPTTTTWYKISEQESLDITLTWASITGKPTSTPAQIDAAVAASHTHGNKPTLDLLSNTGDLLLINGQNIRAYLDEEVW
jgi:hypothetical protein